MILLNKFEDANISYSFNSDFVFVKASSEVKNILKQPDIFKGAYYWPSTAWIKINTSGERILRYKIDRGKLK